MARDKWGKLKRWLQIERARSVAHRDHRQPDSPQYKAWNSAIQTLDDVIEQMAEIEGTARSEAQEDGTP
jgi:hypothetical protein